MQQGVQPQKGARARKAPTISESSNASGPSHSINGMVATAVWWMVNRYSAQFLSWISRFLYSIYCNWLIGGATGFWGNVKWFFVCMRSEEDISNYAYSNSQQILSLLTAGGAYWMTHRFQRFWYRASSIAQAGANVIENDLRKRLDSIQGSLEKMAQRNEEDLSGERATSPVLTRRRSADSPPPSRKASSGSQSKSKEGYGLRINK